MISPLQKLSDPFLEARQLQVFMKRDDLLHPFISGNKWRKLQHNLAAAKALGQHTLLTFGGAFSNHIHAVAAAGSEFGFRTIGIIRGESVMPLNATLSFAAEHGMQIHFISRHEYRQKSNASFISNLHRQFGEFYLLPEGGSNTLAVKGCADIIQEINFSCDYLCCPVGTGATMAGLIAGAQGKGRVLGFSVLKGIKDLEEKIAHFTSAFCGIEYSNWSVYHDYHFGGYAKLPATLKSFIEEFRQRQDILLDPVYTGKMMFGIYELAGKNFFPAGSTIIAIHTGGLQGWNGFV
ncbi:MAG: pyridoxal-phosphate dependent enzyme [Chitinophagales bacterium]|nr:pyridoxal-phosphate dependent enzyme [Chitinophagales bacterium]